MKIVDKEDAVDFIVKMIKEKARYQKVVFCTDKNSNIEMLDKICTLVGRSAVIIKYYYNKKNIKEFFSMINNGARLVVYDVSVDHFYNVQNNNTFLLNVFISQSSFVFPYIGNVGSVYGENVLITELLRRDYNSIILMYELALDDLWGRLLSGASVNTEMFKKIDSLMKCDNFYNELIYVFECLKNNLTDDYGSINEREVCGYMLMRIGCILKMLTTISDGRESYIDFYKRVQSTKELETAYQLIVKSDLIDILRLYCSKLIKISIVIIDRIKIIINKYLNNNINLKRIIKNITISPNINNLLYIAYILDCV